MSSEGNTAKEMSFWDHLEELRGTIVRSVLVLVAVFVVLFFFKEFVFDTVVLGPTKPSFWFYRLLGINMSLQLINIDVTAQFFTHIKVTFIAAFVVTFPFICYQLWRFIAPALYQNEKKTVRGAFGLGAGLFYLGICTGYFLVVPLMLVFFNGYQVSATIENTFNLNSYISIFSGMVFMMGLLFEFPSVLAVLSHFGIITREFLKQYRRHAIVVIIILAAILTPTGDPFTLLVVSVPLYLLYEFSVFLCKPAPKEEIDEDDGQEDS